ERSDNSSQETILNRGEILRLSRLTNKPSRYAASATAATPTATTATAPRQHVHDKAADYGVIDCVDEGDGLQAERVERVAKDVTAVVVVGEREILGGTRGIRAAEVDCVAIPGDHVTEGVDSCHRDLEANALRDRCRTADREMIHCCRRDRERYAAGERGTRG